MYKKGVIRQQVDWKSSRSFFYWRLRRRLLEFHLANIIMKPVGGNNLPKLGSRKNAIEEISEWYRTWCGNEESWDDDKVVVSALENEENQTLIQQYIDKKTSTSIAKQIGEKMKDLLSIQGHTVRSGVDELKKSFQDISEEEKAILIAALTGRV